MEPQAKKPWQSKTVWLNLILAIAAFFPAAQDHIKENPDIAAMAVALVNVVMRLLVKDKVALKKPEGKAEDDEARQ